ncbi:hypothetical protein [Telluribacter sp.]|jgi:hypothetical protein|uniref:hypothetical protein n=1 Tax=Telluribacter sp. TaxID=1978767 RepID=UPI002E113845|nr:hypothetical protein [Telluribacter sp.]
MKLSVYTLLMALSITACNTTFDETPPGPQFDGTAYRPVYATSQEIKNIQSLPARALKKPGKIYLLGSFLFINEMGAGVHIINNSDPKNPENLAFVSIPANYDIAVKGNWLYADNGTDLVVFDISNPREVRLARRIEKAIPLNKYPPFQNTYFECVDDTKGVVVSWEKVTVSARPSCYR